MQKQRRRSAFLIELNTLVCFGWQLTVAVYVTVHVYFFVTYFLVFFRLYIPVNFFSHVRMFSWLEDEMSFSRTRHCYPNEILTHDLGVKSPAF